MAIDINGTQSALARVREAFETTHGPDYDDATTRALDDLVTVARAEAVQQVLGVLDRMAVTEWGSAGTMLTLDALRRRVQLEVLP